MDNAELKIEYFNKIHEIIKHCQNDDNILPTQETIKQCVDKLSANTPDNGVGLDTIFNELIQDIVPALNAQHKRHYYGFVTGGVTPAAHLADNLVTAMDQNVQVYLPNETAACVVEDRALRMLLDMLQLEEKEFTGRTFTTGATASNVLGLACGREAVLTKRLEKKGISEGVAELGIFDAMNQAGVSKIQVLSCSSHSSTGKAAAIVGLGRKNMIEAKDFQKPWDFDLIKLENELKKENTASIVSVNFGEVNTGMFTSNIKEIRALCDKYDAWMHVDGAFGLFARVLLNTDSKYSKDAQNWVSFLELADSITGDNHKTLNVPYDCGFFFTRNSQLLQTVFQNPGAVYLSSNDNTVPSPLNIGIENSRRFRALPVYATLRAYGKQGYKKFIEQLIEHTREIANYINNSPHYTLLPVGINLNELSTVVLVKAVDSELNDQLKNKINETRQMYASWSKWEGDSAVRIAVCNWQLKPGDSAHPIAILESLVN